MAKKGFVKAEEISKEDMEKLAKADADAAVKGQKEKRATKAYADEFTEETPVSEEDAQGADVDVPEELKEPEEPEVAEKQPVAKKNPTETTERSAEEIAQGYYNHGWQAGYKHRTKELLDFLVG